MTSSTILLAWVKKDVGGNMESTNIIIGRYDRLPGNVGIWKWQRQHGFDQLLLPILLSDFSHVKISIYCLENESEENVQTPCTNASKLYSAITFEYIWLGIFCQKS